MEFSLAITNYNRDDMLFQSFTNMLQDERISEVVIVDDDSKEEIYNKVAKFCEGIPKVVLYRNHINLGMSRNKRKAISLCKNMMAAIWDSDNEMNGGYFDAICNIPMMDKMIYMPSFAKPSFDYRQFSDMIIDSHNVKEVLKVDMGRCLMNTANYVVPRDRYLEVYEHNPEMKGTDTIWFNYLWLKAGFKFYVVPGMEYFHRQHAGSGFLEDIEYNMKQASIIENKIKLL